MKILLISWYYPPSNCARAIQIGRVVAAIEALGCTVKVIAKFRNGARPSLGGKSLVSRAIRRAISELEASGPQVGWVAEATRLGRKAITEFRPDILLSSSEFFSSHLAGLKLAHEFKIPWVASFSDPWPPVSRPEPYSRAQAPFLAGAQIRAVESVLEAATAIHVPTRYTWEAIQTIVRSPVGSKYAVIPHVGVPGSLTNGHSDQNGNSAEFRGWLIHAGRLTRERVSEELLLAVRDLHDQHSSDFRGLMCIGDVCPEFLDAIGKCAAEKAVQLLGSISHPRALDAIGRAGALLLIEAKMPYSPFLPSKFPDYVCSNRPILAVTPTRGAISDYLQSQACGLAVSHDRNEIAGGLRRLLTRGPGDEGTNSLAEAFSPQRIGTQYMDLFAHIRQISSSVIS